MAAMYDHVVKVLAKPTYQRSGQDLESISGWFRNRSKLFESLDYGILADLIKHCEFKTVKPNSVIVHQGDKGNSFYIVLRGQVSVYCKENEDEIDIDGDAPPPVSSGRRETDRDKLGTIIDVIKDGGTFGELAINSGLCIRSSSCVADDITDLIIIQRELYNRSVSEIVNKTFIERMDFVEKCSLFNDWPNKWKKYVAMSLVSRQCSYEETIVRQGDTANKLYFLVSGELKLVTDPSAHEEQFADFKNKCLEGIEDTEKDVQKLQYFSLTNWLSARSRVADRLKSANDTGKDRTSRSHSESLPANKVSLSPSAIRKKTAMERKNHKRVDMCFLSNGHLFGDIEFLLGMEHYHCSAVCTQPSTFMVLHHAIYERMFERKNPETVTVMLRNLLNQIPSRFSQPHVIHNVPLMKLIVTRIQQLTGRQQPALQDSDDHTSLPQVETSPRAIYRSRALTARSGFSSRSFPMTRRTQEKLRSKSPPLSVYEPSLHGGYSTYGGHAHMGHPDGQVHAHFSNETPSKRNHNKPSYNPPVNPGKGIFIKLLQISNPMVKRHHLAIDPVEYDYLIQLRRRLGPQIEDLYPNPGVSMADLQNDKPVRLCQATGKNRQKSALPLVSGVSNASPRTSMKRSPTAKSRPDTSGKNVFFSVPRH